MRGRLLGWIGCGTVLFCVGHVAAQPRLIPRPPVAWDWVGQPEQMGGTVAPNAQTKLLWVVPGGPTAADARVQTIHKIEISESKDRPMQIRTQAAFLSGSSGTPGLNEATLGEADAASWKFVLAPQGSVIRALQVCQNNPKDPNERELKGIRVWTEKPDAQGKLASNLEGPMHGIESDPNTPIFTTGMVEAKRPNCSNWAKPVFCNSNGAVVAIKTASTPKGFQNLGIVCRSLFRASEPPPSPVIIAQETMASAENGRWTVSIGAGLDGTFGAETTGTIDLYVLGTLVVGSSAYRLAPGASSTLLKFSLSATTWASLGCNASQQQCDLSAELYTNIRTPEASSAPYKTGTRTIHITRPPGT